MWGNAENFKADVFQAAHVCTYADENTRLGNYIYDRKSKKAFSVSAIESLRNFGVVSRYVPTFLCEQYFSFFGDRFVRIELSFLPSGAHLIDFGPLIGTRGAQVKVYDLGNLHVYCAVLEDASAQVYADNEADIYAQYSGRIRVPNLVKRLDESCYVRELVIGAQARALDKCEIKDILDDLIFFYNSQEKIDVDRADYIDDMFERVTKVEALCLERAKWLKKFALLGGERDLRLVKAHGDFAEKNIINSRGDFVIIDWERVSVKSLTYDVCNFFFKRFASLKLPLKRDPFVRGGVCEIQNYLSLNQLDSKVGVGSCKSNYALFLLERLSLEIELHEERPERLKNFLTIFLRHVDALRYFFAR